MREQIRDADTNFHDTDEETMGLQKPKSHGLATDSKEYRQESHYYNQYRGSHYQEERLSTHGRKQSYGGGDLQYQEH